MKGIDRTGDSVWCGSLCNMSSLMDGARAALPPQCPPTMGLGVSRGCLASSRQEKEEAAKPPSPLACPRSCARTGMPGPHIRHCVLHCQGFLPPTPVAVPSCKRTTRPPQAPLARTQAHPACALCSTAELGTLAFPAEHHLLQCAPLAQHVCVVAREVYLKKVQGVA